MPYTLRSWTHENGRHRLYIGGTTRQSIYLTRRESDGAVVWSSKANDTPHRFQTGDHYGKVRKDREACEIFAEAIGVTLGDPEGAEEAWARLSQIAASGLIIEDEEA